jgi:transposase
MLSEEGLKNAKKLRERCEAIGDLKGYRKYSALLSAIELNIKKEVACKFFGYSVSSWYRIRNSLNNIATCMKQSWGGRRVSMLSQEDEAKFMGGLEEVAAQGGYVDIQKIKHGFEDLCGRKVHKTSIYRLLQRHGWRKIAPRKYHPKRDLAKQEEFKKNSTSK